MTGLTYRDSDHTYWVDGQQWPGFTRMLSDLGAYPGSEFFTENSRVRGQQAHLACQLADQYCPTARTLEEALGVLDVSDDIQGYLSGYIKARRELRYRARAWEQVGIYTRLRIAGRRDTDGWAGRPALLDVKSWQNQGANPKHSAEVQTAAYCLMLAEFLGCDPYDIDRYVLALPGGGKCRIYQCTNPADFEEVIWMAQLWHRWREKGIFKLSGDPEPQPLAIGESV